MIERYSSPKIGAIFSAQNRFALFIEIEALLLKELSKRLPVAEKEIRSLRGLKSRIDLAAIQKLEIKTQHDITAFLRWIWEELPGCKNIQRFLHFGLTSSDLGDTALSLQMREALTTILKALDANLEILEKLAKNYRLVPIMGRTHGDRKS